MSGDEKVVGITSGSDCNNESQEMPTSPVESSGMGSTSSSSQSRNMFRITTSHRAPPSILDRVTLGTFHSVCSKILRWHGSELHTLPSVLPSRPPIPSQPDSPTDTDNDDDTDTTNDASNPILDGSFAIIDQTEQLRIIKDIIKDIHIDLKKGGTTEIRPITVLNAVLTLKSKDALHSTPFDTRSSSPSFDTNTNETKGGEKMTNRVRAVAERVLPFYTERLWGQNALDFDDLILKTRELLIVSPKVRENMRKRWKHILVDEFQGVCLVVYLSSFCLCVYVCIAHYERLIVSPFIHILLRVCYLYLLSTPSKLFQFRDLHRTTGSNQTAHLQQPTSRWRR